MAIGSGVSFWSFGLYVSPLEDDFGWSRAEVSLGFSCALLVSGLSAPLVGAWIDARGPRSGIIIGGALTALTYLLLAATNELWQWYVFSSINAVFRQLMFFIPFQGLVSRWFDRRRGIALSVLGTGFSLGGFAVVPIMGVIIESFGWRGAFIFAGITTAAVFIPIGIFVVRNHPRDIGAYVDGEPPLDLTREPEPEPGLTLNQVLRTRLFWVIAIGLLLLFFGMFGWLVHQVPFFESKGLSRGTAAAIVSLSAGAGILTRLTMGMIADRFPRFEVVIMMLIGFLLCGITTLLISTSTAGIAIFLIFWVMGTSAGPMIEALLLTRSFGVANFATILGAVVVVETIGQIISPFVAGAIYDSTGSYDLALIMFICTFTSALILFTIASRMKRPIFETRESVLAGVPLE